MANSIKFTDTVEFKPVTSSIEKKDSFVMQNGQLQPIVVKIAATHAGIITRNNGFYLPDRMRKGAASFVAQYGKPIQTHHNQEADPVGRVIRADYVDITEQVRDSYSKKISDQYKSTAKEEIMVNNFNRFIDGKMPYIEAVNYVCDSFAQRDSVLENPDYQGLGYIQLTAKISEPDAIQKVLDGRYLTGSVGVTTNRAVCSVCKQDWTGDDGRCDHRPGKIYDGAKAFLITGDLTYDEYSFVNVPADRHSRVIEVNTNGIMTDSVEMDSSLGKTLVVSMDSYAMDDKIEITDSQEDKSLMDEKILNLITSYKQKYGVVIDEAKTTELASDLANAMKANTEEVFEYDYVVRTEEQLDKEAILKVLSNTDATAEAKLTDLKVIRPFLNDEVIKTALDSNLASTEAIYDAINEAEWNAYSESEDEDIAAYLAEHPEDGTLKASQRKRLPGSSFCGPNRSFPVPDCAHVTAARRLIGRAKASSATKAKILSCVSRKSSALGCEVKKDAVVVETQIIETPVTQDTATADCGCKDAATQIETLTKELETARTEYATHRDTWLKSEETLTKAYNDKNDEYNKIKKELEDTRAELKLTHEDLTQMADQLVNLQEATLTELADKIIMYKKLSGEKIEDSVTLRDSLVADGEAKAKDMLTELAVKVDMNKIADSINSGLTRQTVGTVIDPSLSLQDQTQKKVFDRNTVQAVYQEHLRIKMGGSRQGYGRGHEAAKKYLEDMQSQGFIPTNGESRSV